MNKTIIPHSKPYYDKDDEKALIGSLRSRYTASGGPSSEKLKKTINDTFAAEDVILTSSGSTSLLIGLIILGIEPGDEVILPTYVCRELYDVIVMLNCKPVLVDIDSEYYTITVETVINRINQKTKAIILPYMFGISLSQTKLEQLLNLGIPIIEDLSQSIGSINEKGLLGTFGCISILSFKSIKILGGGEGGALVINNQDLLRNLDYYKNGDNPFYPPLLFEMSDINASLTLSQWEKLSFFIGKRQKIAFQYNESLKNLNVKLPKYSESFSWYRYPILLNEDHDFLEIQNEYFKYGILVRKPVDALLHQTFKINNRFPKSENIFKRLLSIPLYPSLTEKEIEKIILASNNIL